jgi:hypothetical protein
MFSSRKYIRSLDDIPESWIFKYYLGLTQDITGESIRIKSVFNTNDNTPSMFIYVDRNSKKIVFKCHSSGRYGNACQLVQDIFNLKYDKACEKIIQDYYKFCETGEYQDTELIIGSKKWTITDYKVRGWYSADAKFWLQFNIGSSLLEEYNVKPLEYYEFSEIDTETGVISNKFINKDECVYGYFTGNELYKVYNPKNKKFKFFLQKKDYVQGYDQLTGKNTLIIASSLKDVMAIKSLGLTVDCIAPNSESSKFKFTDIHDLQKRYSHVIVCMDSDEAGIASMRFYEKEYGLPYVYLPREKDISDIIKHHGKEVALYDFYPKLLRAIEKYIEKNS